MWPLHGPQLRKTVLRVGLGLVLVAALSVGVVAGTAAISSAGRNRTVSSAVKHHRPRQRVSHFNVGATHSPRVLRQLAGRSGMPKRGMKRDRKRKAGGSTLATGASLAAGAASGALQGVDVAAYQHPNGQAINWKRAARSGIQFAAVKATEGTYYRNPFALTDLTEAKAAGLSVIAYVFAVPNGNGGSTSPQAQADYLIQYLDSAGGPLPPIMLDIEYNPYGAECYGLSQPAMRSWIAHFSDEVLAKTGEDPIIYGPAPWWQDCTGGTARFSQFPLWVPDYTTAPRPILTQGWSTYGFWQYSSVGVVKGIPAPGDTDLDQLNPADIPLLDPGSQTSVTGSTLNLQIKLADPVAGQTLSYSAAGLPPGTSISPAGQVTGWPVTAGTYQATVSASDSAGQSGSVSFGWTVTPAPDTGPTGPVQLALGGECLTAAVGGIVPPAGASPSPSASPSPAGASASPAGASPSPAGTSPPTASPSPSAASPSPLAAGAVTDGTPAEIRACTGSSAQTWTYAQDNTLRNGNKCLTIPAMAQGATVELEPCASTAGQQWHLVYPRALNPALGSRQTALVNPRSGMCLGDPGFSTADSARMALWPCNGYSNEAWTLPAGPVMSQIPGMCLDDSGDQTANGSKVDIFGCNGTAAQAWQAELDGTMRINGKCLDVVRGAKTSGSPVDLFTCNGTQAQQWHLVSQGAAVTLMNPGSGLCLADKGDSTNAGTQLVIASCVSGDPGISWRVS
jgi:GH25 family lysozyme M1 (1,4-beta-N-acetylmuramidase)